MKLLSQNALEQSKVQLEIRVEGEAFEEGLDKAYRTVAPKLNLPGFRKGKAPKSLVLKTYGVSILFDDAVSNTYRVAYEQALVAASLDPVSSPEVEITEIDETGYTFHATVTKKPSVVLGAYKGLTAVRESVSVSDSEVDTEIEELRQRNARMVDVEGRAVENGDIAVLDYEGFLNGVAFEGGSASNHYLTIGTGSFIPGFEEQIVGHNAGETFEINVTFPDDYATVYLAGMEVVFKITLHAIKFSELPDLDDEFALDVSDQYTTLQELREGVHASILEYKENAAKDKYADSLFDQVVSNMEVELPPVMVETEVRAMMEDFDRRLKRQGLSAQDYIDMLRTDVATFASSFEEPATRNVKLLLALEQIAKEEAFGATSEECDEQIAKLAEMMGAEPSIVESGIGMSAVIQDIVIGKARELVIESAIVVDAATDADTVEEGAEALPVSDDDASDDDDAGNVVAELVDEGAAGEVTDEDIEEEE